MLRCHEVPDYPDDFRRSLLDRVVPGAFDNHQACVGYPGCKLLLMFRGKLEVVTACQYQSWSLDLVVNFRASMYHLFSARMYHSFSARMYHLFSARCTTRLRWENSFEKWLTTSSLTHE
jgi:hypothetical protein